MKRFLPTKRANEERGLGDSSVRKERNCTICLQHESYLKCVFWRERRIHNQWNQLQEAANLRLQTAMKTKLLTGIAGRMSGEHYSL